MALEKLSKLLTSPWLNPDPEKVLERLLNADNVTRAADLRREKEADQITKALVAQAAELLLPNGNKTRMAIEDRWCKSLIGDRDPDTAQLPWNNGIATDDHIGAVFTTARILEDFGSQLSRDLSTKQREDVLDQATKTLSDWLKKWLSESASSGTALYLPFIYRAACAIRTYDKTKKTETLRSDLLNSVGRYAQSILCSMIARHTLGSRTQLDPTLCCVGLMAQYDFSPERLRDEEQRNCLEFIFRQGEALVTACRTTITRLGSVAIGCSGVDILLRLLRHPHFSEEMEKHEDQLVSALVWLEGNCVMAEGGIHEYKCDLYPNRNDAWFNAIVLQFLEKLRDFVKEINQRALRDKYQAKPLDPNHPSMVKYEDLVCGGHLWPEMLEKRFLTQVRQEGKTERTNNGIILFGPPGTGKTTIAKSIAVAVTTDSWRWRYVKLSPVDFMVNGQSKLFKTIRRIFSDLKRLERCVVLFDEMELLVLDREPEDVKLHPKPEWITELVTNAMLPELQELHDQESVIPIVATNSIPRFDKAGRRAGRFDYILPVGFPSVDECRTIITKKLAPSAYLDGLEQIPRLATVPQIHQWLREYQQSAGGVAKAQDIWNREFGPICDMNEGDEKRFQDQLEAYARPSGTAKKAPAV